jgi:hypothetical protein
MLLVDSNEERAAPELVTLIKQSVQTVSTALNNAHMSDYFFSNYDGKTFQFSRKQAGELLGNIDEAERQLADYYPQADVNCQIVEGIISPLRFKGIDVESHEKARVSFREIGSTIYGYKIHPNGQMSGHSFSGVTASMYYAWRHRLFMAGIPTYETINYTETARLLITLYKNEQKKAEEHSTLQRVIIPRLQIREAEPFMKALIYLGHAYKLDIGEKKAAAIAEKFCNIGDLAMAGVEDICCEGIGKQTASKILMALRGQI